MLGAIQVSPLSHGWTPLKDEPSVGSEAEVLIAEPRRSF